MTDEQVDHMVRKLRINFGIATPADLVKELVSRFLAWKLPKDFAPDAGISFEPSGEYDSWHWPTGTNLLDARQAEEMVKHMLAINT